MKQTKKQLSKKVTKKVKKSMKKTDEQRLELHITKYSSFNDSLLFQESEKIIKVLNTQQNSDKIKLAEIQLQAIKHIIETKHNASDFIEDSFKYYPDLNDPSFNEKIYKKKEFHLNRIPIEKIEKKDGTLNIDPVTQKLCKTWRLNPNQNFLKNYLSPRTPYNSILLFHGTGVGKTCSSISIVEEYIEELVEYDKKVIILSNPSIKSNFMKNIFSIERLKDKKPLNQCTKDKYLKLIDYNFDITKDLTREELNKIKQKITKKINKFYSFYGYLEFANYVQKIINKSNTISDDLKYQYMKKIISKVFSNTVLVIDEVHNIKQDDDMKRIPPVLELILKHSSNMKLVLLSATPMYDNSTEIIFIINLMLMNDKRPLIKTKDVFDSKGNLTKDGRDILIKKSRGYISYLRGENILKFPKRLYPSIYKDLHSHPKILSNKQIPSNDLLKNEINKEEQIKSLEIIGCVMNSHQSNIYNLMDNSGDQGRFGSFLLHGLMASNIVFPDTQERNNNSDITPSNLIGNIGFKKIFQKTKTKGLASYKIKNSEHQDIFSMEKLKMYSCKISTIINNIKDSEGVIFIYSKYINSGVVPLAMALEYNGYSNYKQNILEGETKEKNGLKYMIISGTPELGKNTYDDYLKIESKNKDGKQIKVILGTETAAEGLDFKNIREVHILDPWYHLNKLEQIFGRAIRYCSHTELPVEKRNVVIYLYAAIKTLKPNKEDIETVDLHVLRDAEIKSRRMGEIEYLLKSNAIDCNLNTYGNKFIDDNYKGSIKLTTPKNTNLTTTIEDNDNDRLCNYNKCDYKCIPDLSKHSDLSSINYDTFDSLSIKEQTYELKKDIINLYKKDHVYTLEDIKKIFSKEDKYIIYMSLQSLLDKKDIFLDMYGRQGYLVYKSGKYIFKPVYLKDNRIIMNHVRKPLTQKVKGINISKYTYKKPLVLTKKNLNNIDFILSNIRNNLYFLIRDDLGRRNIVLEAMNKLNNENKLDGDNEIDNNQLLNTYEFLLYGKNNFSASKYTKILTEYLSKKYKKSIYNYGFSIKTLRFLERYLSNIKNEPMEGWKIKLDNLNKVKLKIYDNKTLIGNHSKEYIDNLLIRCEIDYMNSKDKKILINALMKNPDLDPEIYSIIKDTNILFNKRDVYYKSPQYNGEEGLYGYKIVEANKLIYYKFSNNLFKKCSREDTNQIKKSTQKKIKEQNILIMDKMGYLENKMPDNTIVLKIRDTFKQGSKGTQKRTGSICGSDGMRKDFIIDFVKKAPFNDNTNFLTNENEKIFYKLNLCIYAELYLRIKNKSVFSGPGFKKTRFTFFNTEETLEYKIN
jgi:hypothetical protein